MGLLGGGNSKSTTQISTETNNVTTNQDNRIAVTDSGVGFKLDGQGNTVSISQTSTTTDYGSIGKSLDGAFDAVQDASRNLAAVSTAGLGAAVALGQSGAGQNIAISENLKDAYGRVGGSYDRLGSSYDSLGARLAGSYDALGGVLRGGMADTAATLRAGLSDAAGALSSGFNKYAGELAGQQSRAFAFADDTLDGVFNFAGDTVNSARTQSADALAAIRNNNDRLVDFLTTREKDPNERAFSGAVPWLAAAAVLVALFLRK